MAKVILGNPSSNVLPRAKGVFYVRQDKRTGPVAQTNGPVGARATHNAGQFYQRQEFGIAANWASNASALDIMSASNMAVGTNYVYRDLLVMGMYANLWEYVTHDGTLFTRIRDMSPNAQYVLDQVTTTIGSMLWRGPSGWVAVPPGNAGQILATTGPQPIWRDPGGGGGTNNQGFYAPLIDPVSTVSPTANAFTWCALLARPGQVISGGALIPAGANTTCTWSVALYDAKGANGLPLNLLRSSATKTGGFVAHTPLTQDFSAVYVAATTEQLWVGYFNNTAVLLHNAFGNSGCFRTGVALPWPATTTTPTTSSASKYVTAY